MSESSRIEIALVKGKVSVHDVFAKLVKGCWVDQDVMDEVIEGNSITFTGGLHDTRFQITVDSTEIVLQSEDYWEMVLLAEELKGFSSQKPKLIEI